MPISIHVAETQTEVNDILFQTEAPHIPQPAVAPEPAPGGSRIRRVGSPYVLALTIGYVASLVLFGVLVWLKGAGPIGVYHTMISSTLPTMEMAGGPMYGTRPVQRYGVSQLCWSSASE